MQRHLFIRLVALAPTALLASAVTAGTTLTPASATGIDSVLASDPPAPPVLILDPLTGPEQFIQLSFDECATAANGAIKACAITDSRWLGLQPNLTAEGFAMSGFFNVAKPTLGDTAIAQQTRTVTFVISGATSGGGNGHYLKLQGARTSSLPAGVIATECRLLSPNGTTLYLSTAGTFNKKLMLGNGTFTLVLSAKAELDNADAATSGTMEYDVTVEAHTPVCGENIAGDCFTPHNSPACSDGECCQLTCSLDPSCCDMTWDADCAALAEAGCAPPEPITGTIYDPYTKSFVRLLSPTFWSRSREAALKRGGDLLKLVTPAHDDWLRRTVLDQGSPDGQPVWIGATDEGSEGNFLWVDGSPVASADWLPGQPGTGDYVALDAANDGWMTNTATDVLPSAMSLVYTACGSGGSCTRSHTEPGCDDVDCCTAVCHVDPFCCNGGWDSACASRASSLCVPSTLLGPYIHPATRHRYYVVTPTSWKASVDIAHTLGTTLAIPEDEAESDWIWHNLLEHDEGAPVADRRAWIGLDTQVLVDEFLTARGEVPVFFDWMPGEPGLSSFMSLVRMRAVGSPADGTWDAGLTGAARGIIELPCEGDLNDDGDVSAADLAVLLGSWQASGADLTGDGITDAQDLSVLLGLWGPCPNSNACSPRNTPGSDLPGCTRCVCELAPICCEVAWDATCVSIATAGCNQACQCDG